MNKNLDKIGHHKDANRIIGNICFIDIIAIELWKTEPAQYITLLAYIATQNNLNIFKVEDYEKSMVLLINSVNNN